MSVYEYVIEQSEEAGAARIKKDEPEEVMNICLQYQLI